MRACAWRSGVAVVALAALAVAGCGAEGESGPGTFSGGLAADFLVSGAVLELHGAGIESVEGVGTTRALHAPVGEASPDTHRVVLIAEGNDPIRFRIHVEDLAHGVPGVALMSAVDPTNLPIAEPGAVQVTLFR